MAEPGSVPTGAGANTGQESQLLLRFVRDQREPVLRIVEGLPADAWHKPVLPSEWTVAGMIWHLAGMEHHWREVIMGIRDGQPEVGLPEDYEEGEWDPFAPFTCELPPPPRPDSSFTTIRRTPPRSRRSGSSFCTSSRRPPRTQAISRSSASSSTARPASPDANLPG